MKRLWILLIIVFILAIVLFVPLVGHHRRKVSGLNPDNFQNRPARIVSLAPNLTEILFALGLDEKIVAVSNGSNYPPEAANKKKIGSFFRPNAEAIIASKPNLVIMLQNEQQKSVRDTLSRFGYQVLTLKIEKIEELLSAPKCFCCPLLFVNIWSHRRLDYYLCLANQKFFSSYLGVF